MVAPLRALNLAVIFYPSIRGSMALNANCWGMGAGTACGFYKGTHVWPLGEQDTGLDGLLV